MSAIGRAGVPVEDDPGKRCGAHAQNHRSCTRTAGHPGGHVSHDPKGDDYWPQDEDAKDLEAAS